MCFRQSYDNNGSVGYVLDPVGNRKSANSSLSGVNTSPTVTYTSDDELMPGEGETYDNNGNTLTTGGKTFTYDAENHLMSMTNGSNVVTMVYDGDGNRVAKTAGTVTTSYLVDDVNPTGLPQVMEELVNGAVARSYTYGFDRISENQLVNGAWAASFYGVDGMDSVRQLTNSSGTPTDTYEYDAFGNMVSKTGPAQNTYTPNNYLYRGEQYDLDLGLYYLRARYYNPVTGRFLSADPLAGEGQRRYEYAGADPVDGVDPTGMFWIAGEVAQQANRVHFPSMNIYSWCGTTVDGQIVAVLPWCGIIFPDFPLFSLGPPPQWIVRVNYRPVLTGKKGCDENLGIPSCSFLPFGWTEHTYVEIDTIYAGNNVIADTWGVLGVKKPKWDNQEMVQGSMHYNGLFQDPLHTAPGIQSRVVQATDKQASDLRDALESHVNEPYPNCPSCGLDYHNFFIKPRRDLVSLFTAYNSNTFTWNVIKNAGLTPPTGIGNAPGYHSSPRYGNYPF